MSQSPSYRVTGPPGAKIVGQTAIILAPALWRFHVRIRLDDGKTATIAAKFLEEIKPLSKSLFTRPEQPPAERRINLDAQATASKTPHGVLRLDSQTFKLTRSERDVMALAKTGLLYGFSQMAEKAVPGADIVYCQNNTFAVTVPWHRSSQSSPDMLARVIEDAVEQAYNMIIMEKPAA